MKFCVCVYYRGNRARKELKGARVWYLGLFCLFIDAVVFLMNHPPGYAFSCMETLGPLFLAPMTVPRNEVVAQ